MKKCNCEILRAYCCREVSFMTEDDIIEEVKDFIESYSTSPHQEDIDHCDFNGFIEDFGKYKLNRYCPRCGTKINPFCLEDAWNFVNKNNI